MAIDTGLPVITPYGLSVLANRLFHDRSYKGAALSNRNAPVLTPDRLRALVKRISYDDPDQHIVRAIGLRGTLIVDRDFDSTVYRVSSNPDAEAEEVTALVDPFCYISHLSAMQRYGLTDRAPIALTLTSPSRPTWKQLATEKMIADISDDSWLRRNPFPLTKPSFGTKVRKRPIEVHETAYPIKPRLLRDSHARIAPVGTTFRDMLEHPDWCGGIVHAIQVWEENARDYLDEIIQAVDDARQKLLKVRAGYLLDERIGIRDPRIDIWTQFAQRGSSQKLDPAQPYAPVFSEKWMLSLNV